MENELMNIQMTVQEYEHYRNYQKELDEIRANEKQRSEMIASLRDQYHREFVQHVEWSKRAVKAEQKIEKLLSIIRSNMKDKLKLDNLVYELEKETDNE